MRSVVPVLHVCTCWFDACGWYSFLYQFQVSDNMYSRKYVRTARSVHEIWGTSTIFMCGVAGSMLVLAYILCTIFKLKYKSVHIYSRKYAYILRSVHDHVSGTVALFVRRKLCAWRYFCIQISSQKLPKYE